MAASQDEDLRPLTRRDELVELFQRAEKPHSVHGIGAEAEKFAVLRESGAPLQYEGQRSVLAIFSALQGCGWEPRRETEDGPLIALERRGASITLEPGSQFELSGAVLPDVHAVRAELDEHFAELKPISQELGLAWLGVGFQPIASQDELGWVPKQRYGIMREYLPRRGSGAHDMMRRTATVQANFDYASEADCMKKLVVSLRLSPIMHAMTANAPFVERRVSEVKSLRGDVWLRMDPSRSGLIERLWRSPKPSYADYVEWALDSGMFLIKRGNRVLANTGQTFRSFLSEGFQGERATFADWKLHLNTLFPEVRLKNTLELRSCDAQKRELLPALVALMTGILYDAQALDEAWALVEGFDYDGVERERPNLVRKGLDTNLCGKPMKALAARTLEIASGGLSRRARHDAAGKDERLYLEPLAALIDRGQCPADELLSGLDEDMELSAADLIARTEMPL